MLIPHTCPPSLFSDALGARDGGVGVTICDRGAAAGIDISVAKPGKDVPCFETIILDPDRCLLLGTSCRSTRVWHFFNDALRRGGPQRRIKVRLEFNVPDGKCNADAESRNSRIFRMAEDIADEIRTQQPAIRIDIEMLTGGGQIVALS